MRIWTLHPKYLDTRGLLAVWRETLLAQKVLKGETKGYRNHPQLERFKEQTEPVGAIADYLRGVHNESLRRQYQFDGNKIEACTFGGRIVCTRGQILYEWNHLKEKLRSRDVQRFYEFQSILEPEEHPIFRIVDGAIEDWEIVGRRLGR